MDIIDMATADSVKKTTVNILGTDYTVVQTSRGIEKRLKDCDGFCDKTTKEIVISIDTEESDLSNFDWYRRKILRHEIVHAFFMESGLQENFESKPFGVMETLVDWIAIQFPKMQKVFAELDIL